MKIKLEIEITGDSSHVSEAVFEAHLKRVAEGVLYHATQAQDHDWNRKIYIGYEEQEDINLVITGRIL